MARAIEYSGVQSVEPPDQVIFVIGSGLLPVTAYGLPR